MAKKNVITYLLELEDRVSAELKETAKQADHLEGELKQLREEQKRGAKADARRAKAMSGAKAAFAAVAVAAAAAAAAFVGMGAHAVATSANLEHFETRLGGLLGGLDKGKARVAELFAIAASTPFQISGLVEAEATLEAFGVNAPKVRKGVMDLAGAMGMDLVEAARAVGKGLSAGAGAADLLREKGVLAMVEVDAGMAASAMTADQFREALFNTLDTNEKLAGGTVRMAETYDGLMSTLGDQFTVFSKQVGDAELFSTAKATLKAVLELLGDNTEETAGFAATVGGQLAKALVAVVDIAFKLAAVVMRVREGWLTVKQVIYAVSIAITEMFQSMFDGLANVPLVGDSFKAAADSMAGAVAKMNSNFAATADAVDEARAAQNTLLTTGDKLVSRIGELAGEYQKAADAAKDIKVPEGSDEIMTIVGVDAKAVKKAAADAKKSAKKLEQFGKSLQKLGETFGKQAAATRKPLKESEKLQKQLQGMASKFAQAQQKAADLGPQAVAAFDRVKNGMIAAMGEMAAAIPKAKRGEVAGGVATGMAVAGDVMTTGGMGALSSAGPIGAAIAGLIGAGSMGEDAFNAAVLEKASKAAAERAAEMQAEADKLAEAGASEGELEARGLGQEDIAAAAEVTEEDVAAAEKETDRGEEAANAIKEIIEGVNAAVLNLITTLPDVLMMLTKDMSTKLPMALMDAIPQLIEELIPVMIMDFPAALIKMVFKLIPRLLIMLHSELPKAIWNGMVKWWNKVWKAIRDFFSIGFQTGGFVPKSSSYLLHQGERVVPASGAGSGTASKGLSAFNAGSKSLTVNTHVVHPDSIQSLSQLISDEVGPNGRTTVPIWGDTAPTTSI